MRVWLPLLLMFGLAACAAPAPVQTESPLTRKPATSKASAAPAVADPFTDKGHSHPVAEEPGVSYTATLGPTPAFIHGRYGARRIDNAVVITLDFHHAWYSAALLRFNDVSGPGFAEEDLQSGGFQLTGVNGEVWGLTIEKDREAFLKALTLTSTTGTLKGTFKGELRPFYGGAVGPIPVAIEFETPFPAASEQ